MTDQGNSQFVERAPAEQTVLEEAVLARWQAEDIFAKSIAARTEAPPFTFYEGPPTANGRPGIHHVMSRTLKDLFCRYKTMKGFRVLRKGGWDTHGLPVEIEVEKQLGLTGRAQVEEYGVEAYNAACRESVLRYKNDWDDLTTRMAYWVDLDQPYITFKNEYIESVWWLIQQIHQKDLLYKGYKIQWYSPGSGTVLSSHEVSLGYKEVQDPSVYVRFPLRDRPNTYFLAWTTTPWTLISNTALAVGERIDYVEVRVEGEQEETFILAEARLSVLKESYEIVRRFKGTELIGKRYEPIFPYFKDEPGAETAWRVIPADFVTTEDGTGMVHMAPAFGADDYMAGQREGLPLFNPVHPDGTFSDRIDFIAGDWFKDADKKIVRRLRDEGILYRHDSYVHNYPHDWRKGTPLMSYPVESWFVRTTAVKEKLIAYNNTINWYPPSIGTGRFGQWLENNVDWALSRQRYWGTPLPIWASDTPGSEHYEVIGSIAELREKCGDQVPPDDTLDLHRPFVDTFTWPAPDGGTMRRIPDLIDVWFDSGAMPFAQWHYPFENRDQFTDNFPADYIAEGVDQTRGWFYTLHAIATIVMDSPAYKNVISNGLLLDEKGEKMSKSKGNAVDPFATIATHGADPVRWYMMSNAPPWENLKWSERGLRDTKRKFFSTLANTYQFFALYANIEGFGAKAFVPMPVAERAELDRWILSRLQATIEGADAALADYHPTKCARTVEQFVDDLSNWYVRRSRPRFWNTGANPDTQAAFQTLYECLFAVAKLMAPIAPFYADWLYQALNQVLQAEPHASVHLADFPSPDSALRDEALEHRMAVARTVSSVVLALRNQSKINVRQPLQQVLVVETEGVNAATIEAVREIILSEVNVKDLALLARSNDLVRKSARANFKVLGKRLGPLMKPAAAAIAALELAAIEAYQTTGTLALDLPHGATVTLGEGDLDILSEGIEGWLVGQEGTITVALDTTLTDALVAEGLAREMVNRVQNLRKTAAYTVTDRVRVHYAATPALHAAIEAHNAHLRNETLAVAFDAHPDPAGDVVETFALGEETVTLGILRVEG